MKFSENWLRDIVAIDATHEALVERLSAIGLEVENVEPIGGPLAGVVVARIVACEKHPEADRLQVCRVDAGDSEPLQIVCGAPNARPGLLAPLATVAAIMPGGMAIKPAKLRGVESFGMLCSAKELGIDADASGLLELPADAPVGAALADYLGLPDATIELKLTPNRADCFSLRGIAHDVTAAFGGAVKPLAAEAVAAGSGATMAVELDAGADAPRFCGRVIQGIDASVPTPRWMADRLRRSGVRPISLLVDVTQYVMLELGQPMHAYDLATLHAPMVVRHGRAGETCKLLDGREAALDDGFLVIADSPAGRGSRAIALGGIMGGFDTRVTAGTRDVFLEAAHFAPAAIIGRSRKLGLHTDAGHRFERGVDPQLPPVAVEYATRLIVDIAGGTPGPLLDVRRDADLPQPSVVRLRRARLARVLGVVVADAQVERILRALGMAVEAVEEGWHVTPPSRRFDIAIEEDLIEEIARIHGYDAIPVAMPSGQIRITADSELRVAESDLRRQLAARGFREAIEFAFVDAGLLAKWSLDAGAVALANPLSAELGVMRTSLLPGLVQAACRNLSRQQSRLRLFEIGRVFGESEGAGKREEGAGAASKAQKSAPRETVRIAAVACGGAHAEQWGVPTRGVDFHDLAGDLESLAALAGASALRLAPARVPWLHPGRSAQVWKGEALLGHIGHLHPRLLKALDVDAEVVVFELDVEPLCARALPAARDLSRFPSVRRDLALVVPDAVPWAALHDSVHAALGAQLQAVRLFDVYHGQGLEAGTKSVAMGLILQDVSRTLTDRDADTAVAAAVAALGRDCRATLRGA
ncbi:MAG: phenylalanine--tRNA ligase subunit beta [Proteobacteria bacterium]|nr:phenylalanine--tRNA ligase subunit beta [Pseudomonadota bacterium]